MRPVIREVWSWRKEVRRTRCDRLTPEEQESVRRALRVLRYEAGSLVELARWLGMPYQSVRHLFVPRRPISIETALRVARVARVSLAEVLGARWVATARCPLCGRSG